MALRAREREAAARARNRLQKARAATAAAPGRFAHVEPKVNSWAAASTASSSSVSSTSTLGASHGDGRRIVRSSSVASTASCISSSSTIVAYSSLTRAKLPATDELRILLPQSVRPGGKVSSPHCRDRPLLLSTLCDESGDDGDVVMDDVRPAAQPEATGDRSGRRAAPAALPSAGPRTLLRSLDSHPPSSAVKRRAMPPPAPRGAALVPDAKQLDRSSSSLTAYSGSSQGSNASARRGSTALTILSPPSRGKPTVLVQATPDHLSSKINGTVPGKLRSGVQVALHRVVPDLQRKLGTRDPVEMAVRLGSINAAIPAAVPVPAEVLEMVKAQAAPPKRRLPFMPLERDPDPLLVTEYAEDIYRHLRTMEIRTMPAHVDYMKLQPCLDWQMRTKLLCWIIQIHARFRLVPETLFLTVNIIDRFLALKQTALEKLQLLGVVALLVASKFEEIRAPSVADLVYMVDGAYTADEILLAERFVLNLLRFELGFPGPYGFIRRISGAENFDATTRNIAKFFLEVAMLDPRLIQHPSSHLAAASMLLARRVSCNGEWTPHHELVSGYSERDLLDCVYVLLEDVRITCSRGRQAHAAREGGGASSEASDKDIEIVFDKYATDVYGRVSLRTLETLSRLGMV
ncbi:B-type cyclin [Polyrhizophydium stewartii]|uniref:B-type cyclin n=1 Tax=Polyrhizophydium stewartii TaxID=2732419 RepID=A0ABR4N244_9FUNG